MTAQDVTELVLERLGTPRQQMTVDRYLAGDPGREVHGVAVTMMATLDVLQRAASRGLDLVIAHEPLFFHHSEDWNPMLAAAGDPVYAAKAAMIERHGIVVHRLHDALHTVEPDWVTLGTARALGWLDRERPGEPGVFDLPTMTLDALAGHVAGALGAAAVRVVGDPALKVSVVGVQPGFWGFERNRATLATPGVDCLVIGESHEWETAAYAADAVTAGLGKGLVVVGHVPSEQEGMREVTRWLTALLPELPVELVPAADPFHTVA